MSTYAGYGAGAYGAMGGTITFDWVPEPYVLADELFKIAGALEDTASPILLSREVAKGDVRDRFMSKTTPDGAAWAPWARDYPDSESILIRTHALMDAATGDAAYNVTTDALFFDFGALPFYGVFHEFGAERSAGATADTGASTKEFLKRAKALGLEVVGDLSGIGVNTLPARPFAGLSFEAELRIVEIFDQWFQGAIALGTSSKGKVFARHAKRGPGGRFV